MFENPITFGFLISIVVTLIYYMVNKKVNKVKEENNQKYAILFGASFIASLFFRMYINDGDCVVNTPIDGGDAPTIPSITPLEAPF
jgi:hypothetical protein